MCLCGKSKRISVRILFIIEEILGSNNKAYKDMHPVANIYHNSFTTSNHHPLVLSFVAPLGENSYYTNLLNVYIGIILIYTIASKIQT